MASQQKLPVELAKYVTESENNLVTVVDGLSALLGVKHEILSKFNYQNTSNQNGKVLG